MFAVERQKRILELLKENGAVWVSKLSAEFGVTEETVRRDLEKLEQREALVRTHGGAVPVDDNLHDLSLEKRKNINVDAKERLAREAVNYIVPGDTIFLDASTTTFYIAKELKNVKNITVITNSLRVMNELSSCPDVKVIAVGGMVSTNQSLVGGVAEASIRESYFANKMFFSSRGIHGTAGILESNEQEGFIKQGMMANATKRFFVCDRSKIGRIGFIRLAHLEDLDYVITEEGALDELLEHNLKELGVKIVTAAAR